MISLGNWVNDDDAGDTGHYRDYICLATGPECDTGTGVTLTDGGTLAHSS